MPSGATSEALSRSGPGRAEAGQVLGSPSPPLRGFVPGGGKGLRAHLSQPEPVFEVQVQETCELKTVRWGGLLGSHAEAPGSRHPPVDLA